MDGGDFVSNLMKMISQCTNHNWSDFNASNCDDLLRAEHSHSSSQLFRRSNDRTIFRRWGMNFDDRCNLQGCDLVYSVLIWVALMTCDGAMMDENNKMGSRHFIHLLCRYSGICARNLRIYQFTNCCRLVFRLNMFCVQPLLLFYVLWSKYRSRTVFYIFFFSWLQLCSHPSNASAKKLPTKNGFKTKRANGFLTERAPPSGDSDKFSTVALSSSTLADIGAEPLFSGLISTWIFRSRSSWSESLSESE